MLVRFGFRETGGPQAVTLEAKRVGWAGESKMIKCLPGHTWLWVTAWKRENRMGPQANDFQVCWPSCLATGD